MTADVLLTEEERQIAADREYYSQYKDAMVTTLISSGALFSDPDRRIYVPSTGFPHVCRIDTNKCDASGLETIAEQYAVYIAKRLGLDLPFWKRRRFKYVAADSPKARVLAKAVVDCWARQGVKKRLIHVPEQCHQLKGNAIIVDDAARTGSTIARSAYTLMKAGATVSHMFCVFNYQSGTDQTLDETFKDVKRKPALDFMLRRDDRLFLDKMKKNNVKHNPMRKEELALYSVLCPYLTGAIRYSARHMHQRYVNESRPLNDIIVPTSGNNPDDLHKAFERAILRLTLEVEMYPHEQMLWYEPSKNERVEPGRQVYSGDHFKNKTEVIKSMDEVRDKFIKEHCPSGLPWMQALPFTLRETLQDAVNRRYSLNSTGVEHTHHVREVFRLLKKHQPGIPYNIFGLPEWDTLSRI
jgi:hypothetical protein